MVEAAGVSEPWEGDGPPGLGGGPPGRGLVAYDFLLCRGGAERLSLELAGGLGAELVSAFREPGMLPDEWMEGVRAFEIGGRASHPALRALRAARAFERHAGVFTDYDWVIFSGAYAPLGVIGRPDGASGYYCHTPPRFIYDLREWYMEGLPPWRRIALQWLIGYLRPRYEAAVRRMDRVVANSENRVCETAHAEQ